MTEAEYKVWENSFYSMAEDMYPTPHRINGDPNKLKVEITLVFYVDIIPELSPEKTENPIAI